MFDPDSLLYCQNCCADRQFVTYDFQVACSTCGFVDPVLTGRETYVQANRFGGAELETVVETASAWDASEQKFLAQVESQIRLWLEEKPHRLVGSYAGDLVKATLNKYKQIRQAEYSDLNKRRNEAYNKAVLSGQAGPERGAPENMRPIHPSHNFDAIRVPYHIAIAIKMELQETKLVVLYRKLEEARNGRKAPTRPAMLPARAAGDGKIPVPTLDQIFNAAQPQASKSAQIESRKYLSRQYRRFLILLNAHVSALDAVLCSCIDVIERLKTLTSAPHQIRVTMLHTRQRWSDSDFDQLNSLDWDAVLPVAYNLYRAQQCVSLLGSRSSPMVALALTIHAITALLNRPLARAQAFIAEVAQHYDLTHWVAAERFVELKRFLVAWSTSIPDAGIPFPSIPLPSREAVGDGFTGWNGDKRRAIPEADLAANAARTVADHWEAIYRARLRTRTGSMPYEEELGIARRLCGKYAAKSNKAKRRPKGTHTPARVIRQPSATPSAVSGSEPRTPKSAFSASPFSPNLSVATYPNDSARASPTSMARYPTPDPALWPLPPCEPTEFTTEVSPSTPTTDSEWTSPAHVVEHAVIKDTPTIEDMLAICDDSSDSYTNLSSDDGHSPVPPSVKLDLDLGLRLSGVDFTPSRGFTNGFSVNPSGHFAIEKAKANTIPLYAEQSYNSPRFFSDTTVSPSSVPRPLRTCTLRSDRPGSVSEANRTVEEGNNKSALFAGGKTSFKVSTSARRGIKAAPAPLEREQKSPSVESASTLHSLNSAPPSAPMSRTSTNEHPADLATKPTGSKQPETEIERQHIGQLIREREEYITYRQSNERMSGRLVSEALESFMLRWVEEQKCTGSIPPIISINYLRHIGIETTRTDLRSFDLGPWVEKNRYRWSVTESLLRAGIQPTEFPAHCIPYSHTKLNLDLYFYNLPCSEVKRELLTKDELEEELELLFMVGPEKAHHHILATNEVETRRRMYDVDGAFECLNETSVFTKKRQAGKGLEDALTAAKKEERSREEWNARVAAFVANEEMNDEALADAIQDRDLTEILHKAVKLTEGEKRERRIGLGLEGGNGAEVRDIFSDEEEDEWDEAESRPAKRRNGSKTRTGTPLDELRGLKDYTPGGPDAQEDEGSGGRWQPDMSNPEVVARYSKWQQEEANVTVAGERKKRRGVSELKKREEDERKKGERKVEKEREKRLSEEEKDRERVWERERRYWRAQIKRKEGEGSVTGKRKREGTTKNGLTAETSRATSMAPTTRSTRDGSAVLDAQETGFDEDVEMEEEIEGDEENATRRKFLALANWSMYGDGDV